MTLPRHGSLVPPSGATASRICFGETAIPYAHCDTTIVPVPSAVRSAVCRRVTSAAWARLATHFFAAVGAEVFQRLRQAATVGTAFVLSGVWDVEPTGLTSPGAAVAEM